MKRREFLKGCAGILAGGAILSNRQLDVNLSRRPNIILCMADDQGWHEMGYYGHPYLKTPALDQLAGEGLRFDRFYSGHPSCSPTRASCMTGRNPNRMGTFSPNHSIRPEEITIAELLKNKGYATGHFGKWHLGPVKGSSFTNPGANGFDTWLSHDNFFELNPPLVRDGGPVKYYPGESSEIVVNAAIDFIEENKRTDKPFFTVVWFGSPHGPYAGVEEDLAHYGDIEDEELKHRFAEITAMDRAIGDLQNYLQKAGLADDTLFWYCSDNGIPDSVKVHTDLRGSKGNLYEGGVKVPGIITWPAVIKKPSITNVPCVTSDIMPTLCELLGISLPDRPIDGTSLVGLIEGSMTERDKSICFWKYDKSTETDNEPWLDPESQVGTTPTTKNPAIQFLNFKHPVPKTENFGGSCAIMGNQYKLVVATNKDDSETMELFDIVADPNETMDLATSEPAIVSDMRAELAAWQISVEESLSGYDYS
jgi:arylsulfatase A-like enzyme